MKHLQLVGLLLFVFLLPLISCKQKETAPPPTVATVTGNGKKIKIIFIGELGFRRTFASIQFMNDEKEIDKYVAKQEKSNPEIMYPADTFLLKRFQDFGFVKDDGIVLRNFKYDTATNIHLTNKKGEKIDFRFNFVYGRIGGHTLTAFFSGDSTTTELGVSGIFQELKYSFIDIIPGGEKELVVLDEWHISNGDNFVFCIYEIKTS